MIKEIKKIYLRSEFNINEKRTPLTPNDVKKLINHGFEIWIEKSENRIFKDEEYKVVGGNLTNLPWYDIKFKDMFIIGLKELFNLDKLDNHKHIYFSHSFKNQTNSEIILKKFSDSNSTIIDFEFFLDNNNLRILTFGYFAGVVGCSLGIIQYFLNKSNKNLNNIKPWDDFNLLLKDIRNTENFCINYNLSIAVIGPNGNTGKGVLFILDYFGFNYDKIYRNTNKNNLINYDIVFNCIKLDLDSNEIWFDCYNTTNINKKLLIVDISCDPNRPNNPINIYSNPTNWVEPIFHYNNFIDIICINNLPSLLPKDSSIYFSNIFTNLLLTQNNYYWENNINYFTKIIEKN